jgi:hypothetical protein
MRRPLLSRVVSLTFSLWLTLFMSASERVVQCATHGGVTMAVASHGAGADLVSTAGHDHQAQDSIPADHEAGHNCSCPGPGCCPPAVAVVPGSLTPMAHVVAVHEAAADSALDVFSSAQDHVLPFATAPPTVAPALAALSIA